MNDKNSYLPVNITFRKQQLSSFYHNECVNGMLYFQNILFQSLKCSLEIADYHYYFEMKNNKILVSMHRNSYNTAAR